MLYLLIGGGPCENQNDPLMEKAYNIIKPSVDGFDNKFDNDNIGKFENNEVNNKI